MRESDRLLAEALRESGLEELVAAAADGEWNACRLWEGHVDAAGYGRVTINGRQEYVHRVVVLLGGRTIPRGCEVDHLCRNRACWNPRHLEVVTHRENALRGTHPRVLLHHAGTCQRGHSRSEAYIRKSGQRAGSIAYCRACRWEDRAHAQK